MRGGGWRRPGRCAEASKRQVKDTEGTFIPPRRERLGGEWKRKVLCCPGLFLCSHLLTASEEGKMGAGKLTQVFAKNSMCSVPLSHFSHPAVIFFSSVFLKTKSHLHSLYLPRTFYVDQAALEFTEVHLPLPPDF